MADLGTDFSGVDDLDANLSSTGGRRGLAEALAARLSSKLLWYDRDYGYDIRDSVGASLPFSVLESRITQQCFRDERVRNASADASIVERTDGSVALSIDIALTDDDGPFEFTLLVDTLTVEILSGQFR